MVIDEKVINERSMIVVITDGNSKKYVAEIIIRD